MQHMQHEYETAEECTVGRLSQTTSTTNYQQHLHPHSTAAITVAPLLCIHLLHILINTAHSSTTPATDCTPYATFHIL